MNAQQTAPTLEQRKALREYIANQRTMEIRAEQDAISSAYVGPFATAYLNALSAAEREALCANGEPVELTAWQMIREEYEEAPTQFLLAALVWVVALGVGLVAVAVRQGWIQ